MTETADRDIVTALSAVPAPRVAPEDTWPYVDRRRTVTSAGPHPLRRASDIRLGVDDARRRRGTFLGARRRPRWDSAYAAFVVCGDVVAAVGAVTLAHVINAAGSATTAAAFGGYGLLLIPVMWPLCVYLHRGYERRLLGGGSEELRRVTTSAVAMLAALAVAALVARSPVARSYVALAVPLTLAGSLAGRYAARRLLGKVRGRGRCLTDLLLVGPVHPVLELARQFAHESHSGFRVVGACVPRGSDVRELAKASIPVLGDLYGAASAVRRSGVGAVAVTSCQEMHGAPLRQLAWDLEGTGADLIVAPGLLEITGPRLHLRPVAGLSLLHVEEPELSGGRRLLKAALDRAVASAAVLFLLPVFGVLTLAIRLTSRGPALYRQIRIGRDGDRFLVYKFRSMYLDADERLAELLHLNECNDGLLFKMRNDPRVTPVGRWLRRYSLDELPQLFNVLRGEMSLVGPRPPLPSEVERYGSAVHRRLLVKPGVTGLWQVSGRSDLSWDEAVRLDLRYVENWSLMLDVSILWKTVFAVLRSSGAY